MREKPTSAIGVTGKVRKVEEEEEMAKVQEEVVRRALGLVGGSCKCQCS